MSISVPFSPMDFASGRELPHLLEHTKLGASTRTPGYEYLPILICHAFLNLPFAGNVLCATCPPTSSASTRCGQMPAVPCFALLTEIKKLLTINKMGSTLGHCGTPLTLLFT